MAAHSVLEITGALPKLTSSRRFLLAGGPSRGATKWAPSGPDYKQAPPRETIGNIR